jgi:hypothetical protein
MNHAQVHLRTLQATENLQHQRLLRLCASPRRHLSQERVREVTPSQQRHDAAVRSLSVIHESESPMNNDGDTELARMTMFERGRQRDRKYLIYFLSGLVLLLMVFGASGRHSVENDMKPSPQTNTGTAGQVQSEERQYLIERRRVQAIVDAEVAEAKSIRPAIGHHLCDNQDGHYRGAVASIHEVESDTVGTYTAYKFTNGQVAAAAIVRVCTPRERRGQIGE